MKYAIDKVYSTVQVIFEYIKYTVPLLFQYPIFERELKAEPFAMLEIASLTKVCFQL